MMSRHFVIAKRIGVAALAAGALALAVDAGPSEAQSSSRGTPATAEQLKACAARDLELIILLEDRGSKTAAHKLDRAFRDIVRARGACADGDWAEAVRIYDAAALLLAAE